MNNPINVLFLDFDGVINNTTDSGVSVILNGNVIEDRYIPNLAMNIESLCKSLNLSIVITSSWRKHYTYCEIEQLLRIYGITAKFIGVTDDIGNGVESRNLEIDKWLASTEYNIESYLVIDDQHYAGIGHEKFFIKTDPEKGFDIYKFQYAINKFLFKKDIDKIESFERSMSRRFKRPYDQMKKEFDIREQSYGYRYIPNSEIDTLWDVWDEAWIESKLN